MYYIIRYDRLNEFVKVVGSKKVWNGFVNALFKYSIYKIKMIFSCIFVKTIKKQDMFLSALNSCFV